MTNFSNGPGPNPPWGAPPSRLNPPGPQHRFGPPSGPGEGGQQNWGGGQPAVPHATTSPAGGRPPEPAKNRKPLLITAGATVVVLTVVAVIVALLMSNGGGGGSFNPNGSPSEVAKAYLEALSRGDAQAALDLSATQPASTELLTNEILKLQLEKLPITDVEVLGEERKPEDYKRTSTVKVAAKYGGQRTEGQLAVVVVDNQWKLSASFVEATVEKVKGLPKDVQPVEKSLTVFGKPIPQSLHFYVFPGYLQMGSTAANFNINELPPTTFDDVSGYAALGEIKPKFSMTDAGRQAAQDAIRAWIDKCYNGAPRTGECKDAGDYSKYYVEGTMRVRGPVDLSTVNFKLPDYTTVVRVSNLKIPITAVDVNTGKVADSDLSASDFLSVNIGEQPPRVFKAG